MSVLRSRAIETYLRFKFGHKARADDVRDGLSILDKQGTNVRRPGARKKPMGGEYITPSPDWLWCIDGHDKQIIDQPVPPPISVHLFTACNQPA